MYIFILTFTTNQLLEYNPNFEMENYEMTLSDTQDKIYTASGDFDAKSSYAKIYLSVEFIYSKYDQGWQLEDCFWNMNEYDLIDELDDEGLIKSEDTVHLEIGPYDGIWHLEHTVSELQKDYDLMTEAYEDVSNELYG